MATGRKDGNSGYYQGPRFTKNVAGIESFVRVKSGGRDMKTGVDIYPQDLLYVDSNFFFRFFLST